MKVFKRIILWVMISLTIQFGGLFYANNYLFATSTKVKATKVEEKQVVKKDKDIKVPETAKNINLSFNAKYIAYYDNGELKVTNTKTAEEKTVKLNKGVKVSFYKWLPDRNRMLIAEKHETEDGNKFSFVYYDVDKDLKEEYNKLAWVDKKSEVAEIQIAPLINVIYVKVVNAGKRSSMYRIDANNEMKKVETRSYVIGSMGLVPHEDNLIYEDLTYNRLYMTKSEEPTNIKGISKPSLIAVDNEDRIYIGETSADGKISKVFFGIVKEDKSSLSEVDLKGEYDKKDIYVTPEGKIYINNNVEGKVKEVGSGKEFAYSGTFVQMYNGGVASMSEGNLVKIPFN